MTDEKIEKALEKLERAAGVSADGDVDLLHDDGRRILRELAAAPTPPSIAERYFERVVEALGNCRDSALLRKDGTRLFGVDDLLAEIKAAKAKGADRE